MHINTNEIKEKIRSAYYEEREAANLIISIILVIAIFSIGYIIGASSKTVVNETGNVPQTQSTSTEQVHVNATAPTTETTTQQTTQTTTSAVATQPTNQAATQPSAQPSTQVPASSTPSTVAEILALYNESANKVKTSASKVTKNFEDREVLEVKVPDVLQSMAEGLIRDNMGDDTEPVEYATPEDIKANFTVPGQDYVSKLTEADIAEATCNDNGTEYELMIRVNDQVNPTAGSGVGAGFDVIEAAEIKSNPVASMLKTFDVSYTNCVIKCKIDKATGNMTWASYYTPVQMNLSVSFLGTHDASLGISFEKDYTIVY